MHEQAATRALVLATPFLEKLEQHCEGTEPDPNPAVVPPSWNKTEYHERFGLIWKRAARELSEASEITVIGYSLPAADAFFHDLMTLGLSGPTRIRRFTVVDPDAAVAERFRKLLGPELDGRFHHEAMTFEDYARTQLGGGVQFRVL